jgi:hypothetical protein
LNSPIESGLATHAKPHRTLVRHLQPELAAFHVPVLDFIQEWMAGITILDLCITQAQPSAFNKKIQLTRSLFLFYFMLSNIPYGFGQLVSLFDLALLPDPSL